LNGKEIRLKKLFKNRKNLIISAIDHVMAYGYQPGIEDSGKVIEKCIATDALILSCFMLSRHWDLFAGISSPAPVVRLNWSSSFYYPLNYREGHTTIATTVEEAVKSGAEAVICSLFLENKSEEVDKENIKIFSEAVRQKEKLGIPLIGECYVVEHKEKKIEEVHERIKRISRIMTELGADLIKAFYSGSRFHEVVQNVPVPVFTIGAEKLNTDLDVLKKAHESIKQGARGIIFGRNIFMAKNPEKLIKALNDVVNNNIIPEKAVKIYGLKD
jgi:DhnA family fructose-bisphosphate aldolase class Ia